MNGTDRPGTDKRVRADLIEEDTVAAVQFVPATPNATAYAARRTTEDGQVRVMVDPCGRIAGFTFRDERGRCMWRAYPGYDFGMAAGSGPRGS